MDARERARAIGRETTAVASIAALYTGDVIKDPSTQEFFHGATNAIADGYLEASEDVPFSEIESLMLNHLGYANGSKERQRVHVKALRHAKGVLVSRKKSSDRENSLRIVDERLLQLIPVPVQP